MRFLSRLIGYKKNTSYVRVWAKQKQKESLQNTKWGTPQDLFAGMISYLSSFGKNNAPYSGDASIFEIACYFFFNTDLWLLTNKPNYRQSFSSVFFQQLVTLFSQAINVGMDNVSELIVDRLEKYSEISRKDNKAESYHVLLSDLIRRTKYNTLPQKYDLKIPQLPDNYDDYFMLKMYLLTFEANLLMAYLQSLKEFFDYIDQSK